jgi:hypothetical protein
MFYVFVYLVAIVAANLSVAYFGPQATIVNAFLLIGLDLSTRDKLHELWHDDRLWLRMFGLILAGSVITVILNVGAWQIALASTVAFAAAALCDALVYQGLYRQHRLVKMNGSNLLSAAVDSVLFPAIAFGFPLMWPIMVGQFAAKVLGGALWSFVLFKTMKPASDEVVVGD